MQAAAVMEETNNGEWFELEKIPTNY